MINIRPVSDLRNKYPEIEKLVLKENEEVYLTKNGYGSMVVMSIEKYSKMINQAELDRDIEAEFGNIDIEKVLEKMDEEINDEKIKYLNHDEVFGKLRGKLYE